MLALTLAVIAVLLVSCRLEGNTTEDDRVGYRTGSISWGGLERTYLIYIPPSYDKTKSMPLIIALHGDGGTGQSQAKLTLGGFNTLSDKDGFIVIYPDGVGKNWNDGRKGMERWSSAHRENIDDVGFISALIDHLIEEFNIDRKRVYITGISNGAMMSYRIACELTQKIAAIAPVAGLIPEDIVSNSSPSRYVPVLIIIGTDDPLMPWNGGWVRGIMGRKRGKVLSAQKTVRYWVNYNNCVSSPVIALESDKDPEDGTRVWKEIYSGGKKGTAVILYAIEGGGHTWPGGYQYLPERIIGKTSKDINANEVIWEFFKKQVIK